MANTIPDGYRISEDGNFAVNRNGEVLRRARGAWEKTKTFSVAGRPCVSTYLPEKKKQIQKYVSILVAKAFVSNEEKEKVYVSHKNGDLTDNRAENLEWISKRERAIRLFQNNPDLLYDKEKRCEVCGNPLGKNSKKTICRECEKKKAEESKRKRSILLEEMKKGILSLDLSRNEKILRMHEGGISLVEIAKMFHLTRERVRQICRKGSKCLCEDVQRRIESIAEAERFDAGESRKKKRTEARISCLCRKQQPNPPGLCGTSCGVVRSASGAFCRGGFAVTKKRFIPREVLFRVGENLYTANEYAEKHGMTARRAYYLLSHHYKRDMEASRKKWEKEQLAILTLCWRCKRDGRTCPWMAAEKPVPGWDATPTKIQHKRRGKIRETESFFVHRCPLFEENNN